MNPLLVLRYMVRESRGSGGRLVFFMLCLSVGVAAVVAVSGLSRSLDQAILDQGRELLGADVAASSNQPLPDEVARAVDRLSGARRTNVTEMLTNISAGFGGSGFGATLGQLKIVEGEYPFYGTLRLSDGRPLDEALDENAAVVSPELLEELGLAVGDEVRIGGARYRIAATIEEQSGLGGMVISLGPQVIISASAAERMQINPALLYRARYQMLVRLPAGSGRLAAAQAAERLGASVDHLPYIRIETWAEAQPAIRRSIDRMGSYLGLVALLSLVIGGIGVAQAVRAWIAGRMGSIAILKCLGTRPREVLAIYLGQTLLLGLAGSVAGAALGLGVMMMAPALLEGVVPAEMIRPWQPLAMVQGVGLGVGIALVFSVPPLLGVLRVPPALVFRREAEPLRPNRVAQAIGWALLGAGVCAAAWWQSGDIVQAVAFAAGLAVAVVLLGIAAWALARGVGALPRGWGRLWVRYALASLARPGAGTLAAIVALGLGTLVVLAMHLVERHMSDELGAVLPERAPTAFLLNIQRDQWPQIETLLRGHGAERIEPAAVLHARLMGIRGRDTREILTERGADERGNWAFFHDLRISHSETLPPANELVQGQWWDGTDRPQLSIDAQFAENLDIGVGDDVTLRVGGEAVTFEVVNLREVDWRSFHVNFLMLANPASIEQRGQQMLAAVRLEPASERELRHELTERHGSVLYVPTREVIEKVAGMLGRIGGAVRILGYFTVFAGLAILAGAVSASAVRRGREVALLKTLGMTRWGVVGVFGIEYALVGLVAAALGGLGGGVLAWAVVTQALEIPWRMMPLSYAAAVAIAVTLVVTAGIATSARALCQRPIEVLRAE